MASVSIILGMAFLLSLKLDQTVGVCCTFYSHLGYCGDCTMPYNARHCGKGSCNIFGCNCQGGCRSGCTISRTSDSWGSTTVSCSCPQNKRNSDEMNGKAEDDGAKARDFFDSIDVDRDGVISETEFKNAILPLSGKSTERVNVRSEFAKMDANNDGEITADEFDADL